MALFDTLKVTYKAAQSLGSCRSDPAAKAQWAVPAHDEYAPRGGKKPAPAGGREFGTSNVLTLNPFKFAFAVENSFANGYVCPTISPTMRPNL